MIKAQMEKWGKVVRDAKLEDRVKMPKIADGQKEQIQ